MRNILLCLAVIFIFSGCSKKCMNNEYQCTPAEKFMGNVLEGAANTAEFINKNTNYMQHYK